MGKVYRNRIPYAGGGNVKECTLAQYNTWKANGQLVPNTTYNIIDAPNLNETAKQISYDGGTDTVWDKVEAKANASDVYTKTQMDTALVRYMARSNDPAVVSVNSYGAVIVLGFIQGIGGVAVLLIIGNGRISQTIDMKTGEAFSSQYLTFSFSGTTLTITPTAAGNNPLTILKSW